MKSKRRDGQKEGEEGGWGGCCGPGGKSGLDC